MRRMLAASFGPHISGALLLRPDSQNTSSDFQISPRGGGKNTLVLEVQV